MTPKTALSVEEFAALPNDGMKHELNEGELIVMPPPKPRHGDCQVKLCSALHEFVTAHDLGILFTESGYRLTSHTVRGPDVSFVSKSRLQNPDEYFEGGPDLAVEIVSPGDDASDLREKIQQYLSAGTSAVWVVYPRSRQIEIHTQDKTSRALGIDDTLEAGSLLPGFQLPVQALLE
jgi:Uma2 family endonuclease